MTIIGKMSAISRINVIRARRNVIRLLIKESIYAKYSSCNAEYDKRMALRKEGNELLVELEMLVSETAKALSGMGDHVNRMVMVELYQIAIGPVYRAKLDPNWL